MAALIGRGKEIEWVMQVLSRRTKNNPCLIGEAGVGKTAVAEGLAQAIVAGEVPETLTGKQLYTLDMGSLVAGSRYRVRRITGFRSPTVPWWRRPPWPTATSPTGSCRTRPSTSSTRPVPGCGSGG